MDVSAAVLGASGYVGGELLRLLGTHPTFRLAAAVSGSFSGKEIADVFPHLASRYAAVRFEPAEKWINRIERGSKLALFSAAPHGASASLVARALDDASARNLDVHVVDSSADFRFADRKDFASTYGLDHPEAELLERFFCAVPEHAHTWDSDHIGHPGCFATAILLASVPIVKSGLVQGPLFVSAVTGSTGSGRSPQPGTHHPIRHSNLYAYKPLAHRHAPEIEGLLAQATNRRLRVAFVPHSGPFARGIHATLSLRHDGSMTADDLRTVFGDYYRDSAFVRLVDGTPKLKDVVASNYAHIGVATDDSVAVVMCAIDNLVKGAAGGAIQWMNRLWALPETEGLEAAAPAWT